MARWLFTTIFLFLFGAPSALAQVPIAPAPVTNADPLPSGWNVQSQFVSVTNCQNSSSVGHTILSEQKTWDRFSAILVASRYRSVHVDADRLKTLLSNYCVSLKPDNERKLQQAIEASQSLPSDCVPESYDWGGNNLQEMAANEIRDLAILAKTEAVDDRVNILRERNQINCVILSSEQEKALNQAELNGDILTSNYFERRYQAEKESEDTSVVKAKLIHSLSQVISHASTDADLKILMSEAVKNLSKLSGKPARPRDPATCSTVDLRPEFGSPRNQDDIGECHATAASDFAQFFLKKKYPGLQISALDVNVQVTSNLNKTRSVGDKTTWENSLLNTGQDPKDDLNYINQVGVCSETDFPTKEMANEMSAKNQIDLLVNSVAPGFNQNDSPSLCPVQDVVVSLVPHQSLKDINAVLKTADPTHVISDLDHLACDKGRKAQGEVPQVDDFPAPQTAPSAALDVALNRNGGKGEPAIVSFDICEYSSQCTSNGKSHAVLVVGRQWNKNTNSCDYLLRNSWGPHVNYRDGINDDGNGDFWLGQGEIDHYIYKVDTRHEGPNP